MLGVNGDFASLNLFAYCGNNPVNRMDSAGYFWDLVLDILSLGMSIVEVVSNPKDPWAWAGLAGDVVDVVIPFAGGVGEITRGLKATANVTDAIDDAVDGARGAVKVSKGGSKSTTLLLETTKKITGKVNDHHIIPAFRGKSKPYADFISARGIDVDLYTITVDAGSGGMHMNFIHGKGGWNQKWMNFIDNNPSATAKDIYQFAGKMMDDYGLSGYIIHPYGGR